MNIQASAVISGLEMLATFEIKNDRIEPTDLGILLQTSRHVTKNARMFLENIGWEYVGGDTWQLPAD